MGRPVLGSAAKVFPILERQHQHQHQPDFRTFVSSPKLCQVLGDSEASILSGRTFSPAFDLVSRRSAVPQEYPLRDAELQGFA